jgi:uncharacterized protein YwgA
MNPLRESENDKLIKIIKASNILDDTDNEIAKEKIQEIVYILKSLGENFKQSFKFEYNAPYSLDLQIELDELIRRNLLIKEKEFPESGNRALETSKKFDSLLNKLVSMDQITLKLIATIYYLRNIDYSEDIIERKLEVIVPYFKSNIKSAFSKYEELKTLSI